MSRRPLIVTGTGTEIGKTYVSCELLKEIRRMGTQTCAIKPVESGYTAGDHGDGMKLAAASGQDEPKNALTLLTAPLAPPMAADLESVSLDPNFWLQKIRHYQARGDFLLIEGAGGLLSPLTWDFGVVDLAHELEGSCLVVASNRLGCIHDILATLTVLYHESIPVSAVVLNCVQADQSSEHNLFSLKKILPKLNVIALPHRSAENSHKESQRAFAKIAESVL